MPSRLSWQNWTWNICKVKKPEQNCCCPHCRCHRLGYSVPPAHHRTIWYRSTFGPRGPGLSNPTSFLRPALPMAPTTDNNARDERSVLRLNPATFLKPWSLMGYTKNRNFYRVPNLQFFAPGAALWWFKTYQNYLLSRLSWKNWTWHICQVEKTEQNWCCPHCRCHRLGYSVPPVHHRTIWCRSTFGPRGPGLSNPTSFLRPQACSPNGTDNRQQRQRQTKRPQIILIILCSLYLTWQWRQTY